HRVMVGPAMRTALVAAISAALACSTQTAPRSSTPTPNTAVVHSEAAQLIVRLADLPAGYRLDGDEPVTLESMSGGSDRSIVREQALRTGFVGGRTRVFFLDADTPRPTGPPRCTSSSSKTRPPRARRWSRPRRRIPRSDA